MKTYQTQGTCSKAINYEVKDGVVTACQIVGGCPGNTQGVARLLEGMTIEEAVSRLSGIRCGFKNTSCPDQLAEALSQAIAEEA